MRRGVDKGKVRREGHRTVGEKPSLRGWQGGDFMFACLCACFGFPRWGLTREPRLVLSFDPAVSASLMPGFPSEDKMFEIQM